MTSYSDEQRAEALSLYVEHGTAHASDATGIPRRTLLEWVTKEGFAQARAKKTEAARDQLARDHAVRREELRVLMLDKARDALLRMDEEHIEYRCKDARPVTYPRAPADAFAKYALAFCQLFDKYRLEMGEPTSRSEWAESGIDRELRKTVAEWQRQVRE